MTRTDLCPLYTHFENYGVSGQYVGVYCNHGYPCSGYSFAQHPELEYTESGPPPETDKCAFWIKCKRENTNLSIKWSKLCSKIDSYVKRVLKTSNTIAQLDP